MKYILLLRKPGFQSILDSLLSLVVPDVDESITEFKWKVILKLRVTIDLRQWNATLKQKKSLS